MEIEEMNERNTTIRKFDLNQLEIVKFLGDGSYGSVYLMKKGRNDEIYAVKRIVKKKVIEKKFVDHVYNEVVLQGQVKHPFMAVLYGISQDDTYIYLVLEAVVGIELFYRLREIKSLEEPTAVFYSSQIVLCFECLHKKDIAYRDLKPENIMIGKDGYLKLIDFGFCKVVKGRTYTLCGTPEYLAPEILLNKGHGKEVDWWTLGIMLYEMIVGVDPFGAGEPMNTYKNIIQAKLAFPKSVSFVAKSLISKLLERDLSRRFGNLKAGVNDIKNHDFYSQINWDTLFDKKYKPGFIPSESEIQLVDESNKERKRSIEKVLPERDPFLNW